MRTFFDLEANGLYEDATKIHSLVFEHEQSNVSCANQVGYWPIGKGVSTLQASKTLIGHNILCYDIPLLEKLYPEFSPNMELIDTLKIAELVFPNIFERDMKSRKLPNKKMWGSHSLRAWGYRLDVHKGDYEGPWESWSKEMQEYCEQDVQVTKKLYEVLMNKRPARKAIEIETAFQRIMFQQEQNGIPFKETSAYLLYCDLEARRADLEKEIQKEIGPRVIKTVFIPRRDNKTKGYKKGVPFTKVKEEPFNPGSRQQIIKLFQEKYSWQPKVFTDKGNPEITEDVLSSLKYPEAARFQEYFNHTKLISMIYKGKEAWLKHVKKGRIHGRVKTLDTITGRCAHSSPNLAQVPSARAFMGKECRSLFYAPQGFKMVGCDASGIELRVLSHYLYPYDLGEYAKKVVEGDIHTSNQKAAGIDTRDNAKTFIYAFIYGAGNEKLGGIVAPEENELGQRIKGAQLRESFLTKVPAIRSLIEKVRNAYSQRGYLKGLDGRKLEPRSEHSALNTLIQSGGAIIMKVATILMWEEFRNKGLEGKVFQTLNVHDENQLIVKEEYAETVGKIAKESIIKAGEQLNLRCPLDAEYKIGDDWSETH